LLTTLSPGRAISRIVIAGTSGATEFLEEYRRERWAVRDGLLAA
jgi:hypothetical protein